MKKFFGRKKKESIATSFAKADTNYQATHKVSRKPNLVQSVDQSQQPVKLMNPSSINDINFMYSETQGPLKPLLARRLQRPISSPPALAMPRPCYAEPPTRAVLRSYDHDKTQVDPEHVFQAHDNQLLFDLDPACPSSDDLINPTKISPMTTLPPYYDDDDDNDNDDDLGGSMYSNSSNSDSHHMHESAMPPPIFDTYGNRGLLSTSTHATDTYSDDMTQRQEVTSIHQEELHSLRQKLLLLQKQTELDQLEYGQMEQALFERTKWMDAEIDRTQSKIMALSASKRGSAAFHDQHASSIYYDDDTALPPPDLYHQQQRQSPFSEPFEPSWNTPNRQYPKQHNRRHHHSHHYSAVSPSLHRSKSGDSIPCLSRPSSNGDRSSFSGITSITPTDTLQQNGQPQKAVLDEEALTSRMVEMSFYTKGRDGYRHYGRRPPPPRTILHPQDSISPERCRPYLSSRFRYQRSQSVERSCGNPYRQQPPMTYSDDDDDFEYDIAWYHPRPPCRRRDPWMPALPLTNRYPPSFWHLQSSPSDYSM